MLGIIEQGIVTEINNYFTTHVIQVELQKNFGPEISLATANASIQASDNYVAILDLKSSYDTVDREKILDMCRDILAQLLVSMLSLTIGQVTVKTIGDHTPCKSVMKYGVVQGSLLSSTLFKTYIDQLAHQYKVVKLCRSAWIGQRTKTIPPSTISAYFYLSDVGQDSDDPTSALPPQTSHACIRDSLM